MLRWSFTWSTVALLLLLSSWRLFSKSGAIRFPTTYFIFFTPRYSFMKKKSSVNHRTILDDVSSLFTLIQDRIEIPQITYKASFYDKVSDDWQNCPFNAFCVALNAHITSYSLKKLFWGSSSVHKFLSQTIMNTNPIVTRNHLLHLVVKYLLSTNDHQLTKKMKSRDL
jgi:hypothetical protein